MTKNDLLNVAGKEIASAEVHEVIQFYSLTEVEDAPPFRRYIGSRSKGLDLLVENERIVAIQIFVQALQGFSEFPYDLPFGIHKGMSQKDVHQLLGQPLESDEFDSKYEIAALGVRVVINFDKYSKITYLNIGVLKK